MRSAIRNPMAYPTLKEALAYYSREDISSYIFEATQRWHVILVIPRKKRWEINWPAETVTPRHRDELIETLEKRVARTMPHQDPDLSLPFYPSFHVAVRTTHLARKGRDRVPYGYVVESDAGSWKRSFKAVEDPMAALEEKGIFYRCKFSGHRSLHVIVPVDAFPQQTGAGSILSGWRTALHRINRVAMRRKPPKTHMLPDIVRLPYSLNEDTGRVSLPLFREILGDFRPFMADIEEVAVDQKWEQIPEEGVGSAAAIVGVDNRGPAIGPARRDTVYFLAQLAKGSIAQRCKAAEELVRIGDAAAAEGLIEATRDKAVRLRRTAVQGLGAFSDHPLLPDVLTTRLRSDSDTLVRIAALQGLSRLEMEQTKAGVRIALEDGSFQVRRRAVSILTNMDLHDAVEELETACRDRDEKIRRIAQAALEEGL